jgi:two-component system, NarL family, response regulator YdfI
MTRVFLIAESLTRRERLSALLEARGVEVCGAASDPEAAEEIWPEDERVDAVLIDASGGTLDEVSETLRENERLRETAAIVLTDATAGNSLTQVVRAGLAGILPLNVGGDLLVAAIAAVKTGLITIHPEQFAAARTANTEVEEPAELLEALTSREKEVLRMLAEGLANKEIAARLSISEHTVKFHVASIFGKLGAASRAEAVAIGMRRGLILL